MKSRPEPRLDRALGLYQATALVVGSVVGSGIFVSTAAMARILPTGWQLIAVWAFTGLMTALGALTQCELSSRLPLTGGLYGYFREVFGDVVGFFYGWSVLTVAGSGAIAAVAFIFAGYLGEFVPLWQAPRGWQDWGVHLPYLGTLYPAANAGEKLVGSVLVIVMTALNVRGVRFGSLVQSASATAKVAAIALVITMAFVFSKDGSFQHLSVSTQPSLSGFGTVGLWFVAMGGAFWSYDGWGNVASVGGEVKNPQRNLPRAILLGTAIVIALYLAVNLAYLYVLPLELAGAAPGDRVAAAMMRALIGPRGAMLIAALVLLCTFDTVNAAILANARVCFAMGQDGLFWKKAGQTHAVFKTPSVALWLQGGWALVLLVTGSFDLIINMYVFVSWLFYLLIPVALFVLRRRNKRAEAGVFRVPGYPFVPLVFALFTLFYLIPTLLSDLRAYESGAQPCVRSLIGLALVASGAPFLLLFRRTRAAT